MHPLHSALFLPFLQTSDGKHKLARAARLLHNIMIIYDFRLHVARSTAQKFLMGPLPRNE
jgi:hypothetical protein